MQVRALKTSFLMLPVAAALFASSAVADTPGPSRAPLAERADTNQMSVMVVPDADRVWGQGRGFRSPGRRVLDLDDVLDQTGDTLPDIRIDRNGPFSLSTNNLVKAMEALLEGTDIGYSFDVGFGESGRPIQLYNFRGTLTEALNEIADIGGFFWTYQKGTSGKGRIRVTPYKSISVQLPPHKELIKDLERGFQTFNATNIVINASNKIAFMRVDRTAARELRDWAMRYRRSTPLLKIDISIHELNVESGMDYANKWNEFLVKSGRGQSSIVSDVADVVGGVGSQTIMTFGKVSVNFASSFLKTLSDSRELAQASLVGVSGTTMESENLRTQKVIEEISKSSGTTGNGSSTTGEYSFKQKEEETGLKLKVSADYSGGYITTEIDLELSAKQGQPRVIMVGGTEVHQQEKSKKHTKPTVTVLPGETILLQGFRQDVASNSRTGMTGESDNVLVEALTSLLPGSRKEKSQSTEVLIVMRASMQTLDEMYNGVGASK